MEKIVKLAGLAIILLFLVVIGMSYLSSPPADKFNAMKAFVQITKLYADKKLIDPSKVEPENADMQYVKYWAGYLRGVSDAERTANTKRRLARIAMNAENLSNSAAVSRGMEKVAEYVQANEKAHQAAYDAINVFVEKASKINNEETMFSVQTLAKEMKSEAEYFDKLNSHRVLVGQYLNAILEFVKSRDGYYSVNGNSLEFQSPEDQDYYKKLVYEMGQYDNEIDLASNEHREEIRRALNKLFDE